MNRTMRFLGWTSGDKKPLEGPVTNLIQPGEIIVVKPTPTNLGDYTLAGYHYQLVSCKNFSEEIENLKFYPWELFPVALDKTLEDYL